MGCLRLFQGKEKNVLVPTLATATLPEHTHQILVSEIHELTLSVESLRRQMKQFDRDLQDAIDGFYRRRQSDKMRELREEEAAKKPKIRTWKDLLNSPVLTGSKEQSEE